MSEEKIKDEMLLEVLSCILSKCITLEEKIDCIHHTICKNDDAKARAAISAYLGSNYRNYK